MHHFVKHYLKTTNYTVDENNRRTVRDAIKDFPGRGPVERADLTTFLDSKCSRIRFGARVSLWVGVPIVTSALDLHYYRHILSHGMKP